MILLACTLLSLTSAQEPLPAAAAQPAPELAAIRAACAKLTEAPNYTFRHHALDEGMPFGRGPGAGGPPGEGQAAAQPPAPVPVEFLAQVQKDQPVHFQQGEMEAWRKDGVLVWRNAGGAWQRSDMQAGRGFGGGGGERPSEEEMRAMRARMGLFSAQTAQEFIGGFETKIAQVAKSDETGKTVYSGTLTPEGAASFGGARMMGRGGRGGGQGGGAGAAGGGAPAFQHSGSFKLIVDASGRIESLTLDTLMSGSFDGNPVERKRHLEYRFSDVGATKLEVPAEVAAKFAEKPADKAAEF